VQNLVHTLVTARMLKKCVTLGTCSSFLQASGEKSYLSNAACYPKSISAVSTLAWPRGPLLLWPNLRLVSVMYELRLNSITASDFKHFCDMCLPVFVVVFFLLLFKHCSEFGRAR